MSKRKKKYQSTPTAVTADAVQIHQPIQYLYALFGLYWLYRGVAFIHTTLAQPESGDNFNWLIIVSVAIFALFWFIFQLAVEAAARDQVRLGQILFGLLVLSFAVGFLPAALSDEPSMGAAIQSYQSFALAGFLLKLSTVPRTTGGSIGHLLARRFGKKS